MSSLAERNTKIDAMSEQARIQVAEQEQARKILKKNEQDKIKLAEEEEIYSKLRVLGNPFKFTTGTVITNDDNPYKQKKKPSTALPDWADPEKLLAESKRIKELKQEEKHNLEIAEQKKQHDLEIAEFKKIKKLELGVDISDKDAEEGLAEVKNFTENFHKGIPQKNATFVNIAYIYAAETEKNRTSQETREINEAITNEYAGYKLIGASMFANNVRTNGEHDYKQEKYNILTSTKYTEKGVPFNFVFGDRMYSNDLMGNVNYMLEGLAAGFSKDTLLAWAGNAQAGSDITNGRFKTLAKKVLFGTIASGLTSAGLLTINGKSEYNFAAGLDDPADQAILEKTADLDTYLTENKLKLTALLYVQTFTGNGMGREAPGKNEIMGKINRSENDKE